MGRLASGRLALLAALIGMVVGCGVEPARFSHEAYVWQRSWTAAVADSVRFAPRPIAGLRVLAIESGPSSMPVRPAVDVAALAAGGRPVTAVVRIDGSRPPGADGLAPALVAVAAWRAGGVDVVGLEIDHDCATAALPAYAAWLRRERPAGLRFSITALPAWIGSPALAGLVASVDEVVLQVHAVRAPTLFDPRAARGWVERFAREAGRPVRVALPTYRVLVGGRSLAADPAIVARFVRSLSVDPVPGVVGIVWFRLPVAGDPGTWAGPTLAAVASGAPLAADIRVRLAAATGGARDVVIENVGTADGVAPGRIALSGAIAAADGVSGYGLRGSALVATAAPVVAPGESLVVGWVRGEEVQIDGR